MSNLKRYNSIGKLKTAKGKKALAVDVKNDTTDFVSLIYFFKKHIISKSNSNASTNS